MRQNSIFWVKIVLNPTCPTILHKNLCTKHIAQDNNMHELLPSTWSLLSAAHFRCVCVGGGVNWGKKDVHWTKCQSGLLFHVLMDNPHPAISRQLGVCPLFLKAEQDAMQISGPALENLEQ